MLKYREIFVICCWSDLSLCFLLYFSGNCM